MMTILLNLVSCHHKWLRRYKERLPTPEKLYYTDRKRCALSVRREKQLKDASYFTSPFQEHIPAFVHNP